MTTTLDRSAYSDPLIRAVRCAEAGWRDWLTAGAHLTVAGRATCGRDGGAAWAQEQLRRWAADVDLELLDDLADDLLAESVHVAKRTV